MLGAWESVVNYHCKFGINPRDWIFLYGLTIYFSRKYQLDEDLYYEKLDILLNEIEENIEGSYKFKSNIIDDRDKAHIWFSRQSDVLLFKLKYNTKPFDTFLGMLIKKFKRGG